MEDLLAGKGRHARPDALAVDASVPHHEWAKQALDKPYVDVDYADPAFNDFVVDTEVDDGSLGVRVVSGHIGSTSIQFNIYLPPRSAFKNRFFQYAYPVQSADALPADVAFGASNGAYTFQCTGMLGFRQEAAGAAYSRRYAAQYYNVDPKEIYGYVYGGSGGSFVTIGALENTFGVWQGGVPFVQAWMYSMPSTQTLGCLAGLVLGDKIEEIADAVAPGGSGDPFARLDQTEKEVLREASDLGVPLRSLEILRYDSPGPLQLQQIFYGQTKAMDPTYVDDFWNVEGYLGTEDSGLGAFFRSKRSTGHFPVEGVSTKSGKSVLELQVGAADTAKLAGADVRLIDGDTRTDMVGDFCGSTFVCLGNKLDTVSGNAELHYDNSGYLAFHAYHRYTVPTHPSPWDAVLRKPDGTPRYPQRPILPGPIMATGPIGAPTMSGKPFAKMIVVQNLLDSEAWPWKADWYRSQVAQAYGESEVENVHRLWFVDNANHWNGPVKRQDDQTRIVHYDGHYYRALLDLADWVEKDISPAPSNRYSIDKGQVSMLDSDTGGIQPAVILLVGGQTQAEVATGNTVQLTAEVRVPSGQGQIVRVEWDPEGKGEFVPLSGKFEPGTNATYHLEHTFDQAGIFLPAVRVAAQKHGDVHDKHALTFNLGRARVIVTKSL